MSKVLLVDHDSMRREAIHQALERGGFETVSAGDGNEGLRLFLDEVPDAVMVGPFAVEPDESFCRRLRETRPGAATPIILFGESLSGDPLKQALERSRCNAYFQYPTGDERLIEVCRQALVEEAGVAAPEANPPLEQPVFASPDAALDDLEAQGGDIDSHLDSMFETGAPPPAPVAAAPSPPEWDADPEISFETDLPETAQEDIAPATPMLVVPPVDPAEAGQDPESDLLGFDPDTVTFESEADAMPPLPEAPPEVVAEPASHAVPSERPAAASNATETAAFEPEPYAPGLPGVEDLPLEAPEAALDSVGSAETPTAAPGADLPPAVATAGGRSRALLWGAVALVAVVGAAGLFMMLRPSANDGGDPSIQMASTGPASPVARTPVVDPATPAGLPNAGTPAPPAAAAPGDLPSDTADNTLDDPPEDASLPAPGAASMDRKPPPAPSSVNAPSDDAPEVAAVVTPAPAPDTNAASAVPSASQPAAATPAPMTTNSPATPSGAAATPGKAPTPKPAAPAAATPKPHSETIFVPSARVVDAATAGEDFTPPQAINRTTPVYQAGSVLAGGETVVLRVLVNDWGKVVRVVVEKGRAGSPLVEAAVNAILDTRYRPAEEAGDQVRAWTQETFTFD